MPDLIEIVAELPLTGVGKVSKKDQQAQAGVRSVRESGASIEFCEHECAELPG